MKRKYWLLLLVFAVLLTGSPVLADGDFYVVAVGGGVGTKITSVPYQINKSGFYYLAGNLNYSGTDNAIDVTVDDVTIELMGFSLAKSGAKEYSNGIYMDGRNNVEVRNGTIRGFYIGICEQNAAGTKHRIINIRANGNSYGIGLYGNNHVVKNCICSDNLSTGIYVDGSGTVADCVASNNNRGIEFFGPGNVLGNTACSNASNNFWIGHNVATSIMVNRNSAFGQNPNYYMPSGTTGVVGLATGTTMNAGAP